MALLVTELTFRASSHPTPPRRSIDRAEASLMDLAPPSKRRPSFRTDPRRSASLGIRSRVCPSFDLPAVCPLPDRVATVVRPVCCHASGLVPPTWFLTTSTVCSTRQASGLLRPEAERGSLRFSEPPPRGRPKPTHVDEMSVPRNAVHTPRRIPLVSSRTTSPWPLPSCRSCGAFPNRTPKRPVRHHTFPAGRIPKSPRTTGGACGFETRRTPRFDPGSKSDAFGSERPITSDGHALTATDPSSLAGRIGSVVQPLQGGARVDLGDAEAPAMARSGVRRGCAGPSLPHRTTCSESTEINPGPRARRREDAPRGFAAACPHECGPDQGSPPLLGLPSRGGLSWGPAVVRQTPVQAAWLRYIGALRVPGAAEAAPSSLAPPCCRSLGVDQVAGRTCSRTTDPRFRCSRLQGFAPPTSP